MPTQLAVATPSITSPLPQPDMKTPGLASPGLQPPTAGNQVPVPNKPMLNMNTPGYAAPNQQPVLAPLNVPGVRPNPLAGHAAASAPRAHSDSLVETYTPLRAAYYRYEDAHVVGDASFHFVVVGFKEPE